MVAGYPASRSAIGDRVRLALAARPRALRKHASVCADCRLPDDIAIGARLPGGLASQAHTAHCRRLDANRAQWFRDAKLSTAVAV